MSTLTACYPEADQFFVFDEEARGQKSERKPENTKQNREEEKMYRMKRVDHKCLAGMFGLLAVVFLASCVAAVPAAVYYYQGQKGYTINATLHADANKVYSAAVEAVESDSSLNKEKIKKDPENLSIEAESLDGERHGSFKVTQIGRNKSQVVVFGNAGRDDAADELLALSIVEDICKRLGVKYTVVKE